MKNVKITHMTRHHHLVHMTRVLPLLAIIFCLQCFFIPSAFPELQLGNLYFLMSVILCSGVFALYLYDTQIHIFVMEHQLFWQIPLLKISRCFDLKDLQTIDVFDADQPFSNMKLHFNHKMLNLYFIDDPAQVIKTLWQAKTDAIQQQKSDSSQEKRAA